MDNQWLANYLEFNLVEDIKNSNSNIRNKDSFLSHWLPRLRSAEKLGAHEWNNLANIIAMAGHILGKTYVPALRYCSNRTAGNAPP